MQVGLFQTDPCLLKASILLKFQQFDQSLYLLLTPHSFLSEALTYLIQQLGNHLALYKTKKKKCYIVKRRTKNCRKSFHRWFLFCRLLCALEGKYLLQESIDELLDEDYSSEEHDELQCVKFSCSIPRLTGRGFIEVLILQMNTIFPLFCIYISDSYPRFSEWNFSRSKKMVVSPAASFPS